MRRFEKRTGAVAGQGKGVRRFEFVRLRRWLAVVAHDRKIWVKIARQHLGNPPRSPPREQPHLVPEQHTLGCQFQAKRLALGSDYTVVERKKCIPAEVGTYTQRASRGVRRRHVVGTCRHHYRCLPNVEAHRVWSLERLHCQVEERRYSMWRICTPILSIREERI